MAKTRRNKKSKGSVLDVRSSSGVRSFEKLMSKGPLTMVFIKAQWCGACHRFNDEVWNSLTKLKNRNMNLASVDSEMIGQTSLANVPRKFYPTLLLVGKDKKPATFVDEDGTPTNSMPRSNTLSEDREALSALVQNPTLNKSKLSPVASMASVASPMASPVASPMASPVASPMSSPVASPMASPVASPMSSPVASMPSPLASPMESLSFTRSPYNKTVKKPKSMTPLTRPASSPPDVAADLMASQTKSATATAGVIGNPMKGGRLLKAIRNKTASLNAMLRLRKSKKTRKSRV